MYKHIPVPVEPARLAIGVGIDSVPAKLIEELMLRQYLYETFEIRSINETFSRDGGCLGDIQRQAIRFAKKMMRLYPDAICMGIASGVANFKTKLEEGEVRYDILACLEARHPYTPTYLLNGNDCNWQVRKKALSLFSPSESLGQIYLHVEKIKKISPLKIPGP